MRKSQPLPNTIHDMNVYLGYTLNDKMYFGCVYTADDDNQPVYIGYFDEDGLFDRYGCRYCEHIYRFIGSYEHGVPLSGRIYIHDYLIYDGEVNKHYEMEGEGKLMYASQVDKPICIQVEGHFKANKVDGFSKFYYPASVAKEPVGYNCGYLKYIGYAHENQFSGCGVFFDKENQIVLGLSINLKESISEINNLLLDATEDWLRRCGLVDSCWKNSKLVGEVSVICEKYHFIAVFNENSVLEEVKYFPFNKDLEYMGCVVNVDATNLSSQVVHLGSMHFKLEGEGVLYQDGVKWFQGRFVDGQAKEQSHSVDEEGEIQNGSEVVSEQTEVVVETEMFSHTVVLTETETASRTDTLQTELISQTDMIPPSYPPLTELISGTTSSSASQRAPPRKYSLRLTDSLLTIDSFNCESDMETGRSEVGYDTVLSSDIRMIPDTIQHDFRSNYLTTVREAGGSSTTNTSPSTKQNMPSTVKASSEEIYLPSSRIYSNVSLPNSLQQTVRTPSNLLNQINRSHADTLFRQEYVIQPLHHISVDLSPLRTNFSTILYKSKRVQFYGILQNGQMSKGSVFLDDDENSLLSWGTFHNNKLHGDHCRIYQGRRVAMEGEFDNDTFLNGKIFYPSGNLHYSGTFAKKLLISGTTYEDSPLNLPIYKGSFIDGCLSGEHCCQYMDNGTVYEGTFVKGELKSGRCLTPLSSQFGFDFFATEGCFIKEISSGIPILEPHTFMSEYYYNSVTKHRLYIAIRDSSDPNLSLFVYQDRWLVRGHFGRDNRYNGICEFYRIPVEDRVLYSLFDVYSEKSLDDRCKELVLAWRGDYSRGELTGQIECRINDYTVYYDCCTHEGKVTRGTTVEYSGSMTCQVDEDRVVIHSFSYTLENTEHTLLCAHVLNVLFADQSEQFQPRSEHGWQHKSQIVGDYTFTGECNDSKHWRHASVCHLDQSTHTHHRLYVGDLLPFPKAVGGSKDIWLFIPHGHGRMYDRKLLIYDGTFREGNRDGYGCSYVNGLKEYEGQWHNDHFDGKGLYFWNDLVYEGQFIHGVLQGRCQVYCESGNEREIVFSGKVTRELQPKSGKFYVHVFDCIGKVKIRMKHYSLTNVYVIRDKFVIYKGHLKYDKTQCCMIPFGDGVFYDHRRNVCVVGSFVNGNTVNNCYIVDHSGCYISEEITVNGTY